MQNSESLWMSAGIKQMRPILMFLLKELRVLHSDEAQERLTGACCA